MSPLLRPKACSKNVSYYIFPSIAIMRPKLNTMMQYPLPTVEHYPKIYILLELEEIINTCLMMNPSTQSTILGWTGMFMRPVIYALSEPNKWQDPKILGQYPLIWEFPWLLSQNTNIILTHEKF